MKRLFAWIESEQDPFRRGLYRGYSQGMIVGMPILLIFCVWSIMQ